MAMNHVMEFAGESFSVTVAKRYKQVRDWIKEVETIHAPELIRDEVLAGIAVQWRNYSPADLIQICIKRKVLIIQMKFFVRPLKQLLILLGLKKGVTYYGLGVSEYKKKLSMRHVTTCYIHDVRKTFFDGNTRTSYSGASYSRLFQAAGILDEEAIRSLEETHIVHSDWGRSDLTNRQINHASLRCIVPLKLAQLL